MRLKAISYAILFAVVFILPALVGVYGDWLWFLSVNYGSIFTKILTTKIVLGFFTGMLFLGLVYFNFRIAKIGSKKSKDLKIMPLIIVIASLLIGLVFSNGWDTLLKFFNSTNFGVADPVFSNDVSFYAFVLPFYTYLLSYGFVVTIVSIIFSFVAYLHNVGYFKRMETALAYEGNVETQTTAKPKELGKRAMSHLSFLTGILFLLAASFFFLERFNVLFSSRGAVFGAGYADVAVQLPLLAILFIASIVVAVLFFLNLSMHSKLPRYGVFALVAILIVGSLAGAAVQQIVVSPNEFNLEKGFIERNIEYTLKAYNLEGVNKKPFPVSYDLSSDEVQKNKGTIENIRLWDHRPLLQANKQLQLFRTYYDFTDADLDRYNLNGDYKQVLLSPREINTDNLPRQAQTWVNTHLVYTHGYGATISPVEKFSKEGLPEFYLKDIPPRSSLLDIKRPEIYFGQQTDQFVVVKTTTEELDFPQGETNVYTEYAGKDGVELTSLARLAYAVKFGSIEILVSGSIKPDSRILFNRNIDDRVRLIAPFLRYDPDPYMVVSEGKLFWLYDAYTAIDKFPYSAPIARDVNYIRNSVKIAIDAYSGDTVFYVIDEEPVIRTYRKMFPDLFKDFEEMPDDLKSHIRYPEGLFKIQANVYSTFHMKDPRVFYNKEDVWDTPQEVYRGSKEELMPYYVIMKLPEEEREEFILMLPFTPRNKDNMIGWMAARSDMPNYGELIVFLFSKQELIFGPLQIEARIDQDTEISQRITLWSQHGSDVIRGNLLVIPIENSVLYVEPLYLQASETGAVPQLKRVIVAYGDRLTMQESLQEALNVIFGEAQKDTQQTLTKDQLIAEAAEIYNRAQSFLKQGDLAKYAEEIDKLGDVLQKLEEQ